MKESYCSTDLEIIVFETPDVILTSNGERVGEGDETDDD